MKNFYYEKAIKRNKYLINAKTKDVTGLAEFIKGTDEDDVLQIFISVESRNNSLSQLAFVHAMIRDIAREMGDSFESVKLMIKEKAGLLLRTKNDVYEISFADCCVDDLSSVIETSIQIGEDLGIDFR